MPIRSSGISKVAGARMIAYRQQQELTREQLALRLNVTADDVARWETEGLPRDMVAPVADVLGVVMNDLLSSAQVQRDPRIADIGKRIEATRKRKRMSQTKLGELAGGYSQRYISHIESGESNVPIGLILKIADILEIPGGYLIGQVPTETAADDDFCTYYRTRSSGEREQIRDVAAVLWRRPFLPLD